MSPEARVGIFVLLGVLVIAYFGFRTGEIELPGRENGVAVYADFNSIAGLDRKAAVRLAGVRVGEVIAIALHEGMARVTMKLEEGVLIRSNSTAKVASLGILGEKYIEIMPGPGEAPFVHDGDVIQGGEPISMDQIVSSINAIGEDFKAITESFRGVVGTEEGKDHMQAIVANLDDLMAQLSRMAADNREAVDASLENVREITGLVRDLLERNQDMVDEALANTRQLTSDLAEGLPPLLASLERLSENLSRVVEANRDNMDETVDNLRLASGDLAGTMESLRNIADRVEAGEGTLGRLVTEDATATKLDTALDSLDATLTEARGFLGRWSDYRTYVGYRGDYLGDLEEYRNTVFLKVYPRKDKFYLLEIVDSPFGKRSETYTYTEIETPAGTSRYSTHQERIEDDWLLSFQVGRRLGPAVFRGGLIEQSGGVASDLYLFDDRLTLSAEAFDFGREGRDPRLRATLDLRLADYFSLRGGIDDFLEEDRRSYFVGAGISFEDEDFRFLLGLLPLAASGG